MNRIEKLFAKKKELINIFLTAGYPKLDSLPVLVNNLITKGVDIIEVGMPYSDPLADGEVIQKTSATALENGMTIQILFDQIKQIRQNESATPILLMGYFNQVLQVGVKAFLKNCKSVGVDGLIIPDLPYEIYKNEYRSMFEKYDIKISFLVTPQTSIDRILELDRACSAFLYIVSDNSLTGVKSAGFSQKQLLYFENIKKLKLNSPTMIGFGISNKQMVKEANVLANGAIIGSAYLESIRTKKEDQFIDELIF